MDTNDRLEHWDGRPFIVQEFICVLLCGVRTAKIQVQFDQFGVLQTAHHVFEAQEQGPRLVLGIGAQLLAQPSLVRQGAVDVEDAGRGEGVLAPHSVRHCDHAIPVPLTGPIVQRSFEADVTSRARQTHDRGRGNREEPQAQSQTLIRLPAGRLYRLFRASSRLRGARSHRKEAEERGRENHPWNQSIQSRRQFGRQGGGLQGVCRVPGRADHPDRQGPEPVEESPEEIGDTAGEDGLRKPQEDSAIRGTSARQTTQAVSRAVAPTRW